MFLIRISAVQALPKSMLNVLCFFRCLDYKVVRLQRSFLALRAHVLLWYIPRWFEVHVQEPCSIRRKYYYVVRDVILYTLHAS